jgi:hypothetical protein
LFTIMNKVPGKIYLVLELSRGRENFGIGGGLQTNPEVIIWAREKNPFSSQLGLRFFRGPRIMYFMRVVSEVVITAADLVGKKVTIRATTPLGSVSILNGLTGIVIAPHPIAPRWVKIRLDPNEVTPLEEWPVPEDRLVVDGALNA